jgi:hypothetical protein
VIALLTSSIASTILDAIFDHPIPESFPSIRYDATVLGILRHDGPFGAPTELRDIDNECGFICAAENHSAASERLRGREIISNQVDTESVKRWLTFLPTLSPRLATPGGPPPESTVDVN